MTCRRYLVSGRVQGVFFRGTCRDVARGLGLTGWARNRADGRVEVLAVGDLENLFELEAWLEVGPQWAKVSNIEVQEDTGENNYTDFEIHPGQ